MLEALVAGIGNAFAPVDHLATLAEVVVKIIFGLVPGIAGLTAMAIIILLIFAMETMNARALLIALQAVSSSGGLASAIFFAIPGALFKAATLINGSQ